jgi:hypothetical protein
MRDAFSLKGHLLKYDATLHMLNRFFNVGSNGTKIRNETDFEFKSTLGNTISFNIKATLYVYAYDT